MPFEWRVFELAKDPGQAEQNQDAWWLDPSAGVAAIADGVTSGIFSRQWAQILTRAAVNDWPNPQDEIRFGAWLSALRKRWEDEIDTSELAWYQRAKLREGGFATLVWLRLRGTEGLHAGAEELSVEATAIGDSCLFHVRDDEFLESFPLDASLQFDSSPLVLGSVDLKRDEQLEFEQLELTCRVGDLLVLCTDAVAAWALDRQERGEPVAWSRYWYMEPAAWVEEVSELRQNSQMRYDDATLLLLRVARVAGPSPEEYEAPSLGRNSGSGPEDEADVPLLTADDWEESSRSSVADQQADVFVAPAADTYQLQQPAPDPEPTAETAPPVPPQASGQPPLAPPPPPGDPNAPGAPEQEDWRDQVNTFSERLFKRFSEGLSRGVDKLQEAKDSAVRKLREKQGRSSEEDDDSKDS